DRSNRSGRPTPAPDRGHRPPGLRPRPLTTGRPTRPARVPVCPPATGVDRPPRSVGRRLPGYRRTADAGETPCQPATLRHMRGLYLGPWRGLAWDRAPPHGRCHGGVAGRVAAPSGGRDATAVPRGRGGA